ncbi:MAG: histidinol dehydrogenase, partial [Rickettsiales bacterium]|nr:histidinol dehydrogenase [Rickettsiales bacterium]
MATKRFSTEDGFDQALKAYITQHSAVRPEIEQAVAGIITAVRTRGDAAVLEYTRQFDHAGATRDALRVPVEVIDRAYASCPAELRQALERAGQRIEAYHRRQLPEDVRYTDPDGITLGWQWRPVDAVGLYVPGGKAVYPSSVLMNAIPARIAGVKRIAMVVPAPGGEVNPLVLAAAKIADIREVYAIGGAQAVAALAIGTETIPKVDMIVGPGNAYVAAAKR